ncbi:MAG: ABC transporter permease [Candidatus Omnitrophica bacterium]|nr:ABC transporter permease [Candidatus Omnitrophota bacterium]
MPSHKPTGNPRQEGKPQSQWSIAMTSFRRHRLARGCFYVLIGLYACVIFADFLAPYRFDDEDRSYSYCPSTTIEFFNQGHGIWPFVYVRTLSFNENHQRIYQIDTTKKYPLRFFHHGHLFGVDEPGRIYVWGADARGRDLFSRILHGGRISLSIGLIGVLISFSLGLLVGGIAGYFGGFIDSLLMRVCEMFMLVPGFYLMLALRSVVPENFNSLQIYLTVVVILSFIGWASLARIIRGMSLSLRQRDFVLASQAMGTSDMTIIVKHILPHTLSYSLVAIMLTIPSYILGEAGLSLLGLGIQDPIPSWGNMLSDAMGIVQIQFAPWIMIPGIFIFVTVMCFNIIGDALRDAFDPMFKES